MKQGQYWLSNSYPPKQEAGAGENAWAEGRNWADLDCRQCSHTTWFFWFFWRNRTCCFLRVLANRLLSPYGSSGSLKSQNTWFPSHLILWSFFIHSINMYWALHIPVSSLKHISCPDRVFYFSVSQKRNRQKQQCVQQVIRALKDMKMTWQRVLEKGHFQIKRKESLWRRVPLQTRAERKGTYVDMVERDP